MAQICNDTKNIHGGPEICLPKKLANLFVKLSYVAGFTTGMEKKIFLNYNELYTIIFLYFFLKIMKKIKIIFKRYSINPFVKSHKNNLLFMFHFSNFKIFIHLFNTF